MLLKLWDVDLLVEFKSIYWFAISIKKIELKISEFIIKSEDKYYFLKCLFQERLCVCVCVHLYWVII